MNDRKAEFRRALADGVVADGAMGTRLMSKLEQSRGASLHLCLNLCLDELNLSRPELVREVHQEYVRAGAQILGTNTFGANRVRLGLCGLDAKVGEINRAGVQIAREAGRFFRSGVSILGGCSGTTPEHIRRIREIVHAGNGPKASRALH